MFFTSTIRWKKSSPPSEGGWPSLRGRGGQSAARLELPTYRSIYHPVSRSGCHPSFRRRGAFSRRNTIPQSSNVPLRRRSELFFVIATEVRRILIPNPEAGSRGV